MLDDVTVYKFNNKNNYKFPNISNSMFRRQLTIGYLLKDISLKQLKM